MFFFCHIAKIANCLFIIEIAVSVHLKKFLDRIESVEIFFVSEKKKKTGGGDKFVATFAGVIVIIIFI